jgi:hypothetical protein
VRRSGTREDRDPRRLRHVGAHRRPAGAAEALYQQLRTDAEEVRELDDGYTFRHSPDRDVLLAVAEFTAKERLCCPFFEFAITVERGGGPVWLRITGGVEAKAVLEPLMDVGA